MNTELLNQEQQEERLDLAELAKLLWTNKWWVFLAAILGGIIALSITLFVIRPTYRSGFIAFVNNRTTSNTTEAWTSGDTSASQSLSYTYAEILRSRQVIETAAAQSGLTDLYSYEDLRSFVSTSIVNQTQLITVYVTMTDANQAYNFANAIVGIAPDYIASIVEGSSMKIATYPVIATRKHSPSNRRNVMIGVVLGAVIAIMLIFFRAMLDTRVKSEDDLKERFGLPIIGTIPNVEEAAGNRAGYAYYSSGKKSKGE